MSESKQPVSYLNDKRYRATSTIQRFPAAGLLRCQPFAWQATFVHTMNANRRKAR